MATKASESEPWAKSFLVLAYACIGLFLFGLFHVSASYVATMDKIRYANRNVSVVMAQRNLVPGVEVAAEDLYTVQLPARLVPEGAALDVAEIVGSVPRERVLKDDFVRMERLADPRSGAGLNTIIPVGMRGVSISVRDGQGVSGMLTPGSYVDVIATTRRSDGDSEARTYTVLQAAFVLTVNEQIAETAGLGKEARSLRDPSVTLLVDSHQAERLALAEYEGQLHLALRNDSDLRLEELYGIDVAALRRKLPPTVVSARAAPEPPPVEVADEPPPLRIIRGDKVEEIRVSLEGTFW